MAKVIPEANDKMDVPVSATVAELMPLTVMKGVKGFASKPSVVMPGAFKIVMFGCEHEVDESYTEGGDEKEEEPSLPENRKLFRRDKDYDDDDIGYNLSSPDADGADIQTPWDHVQKKKPRQTIRYTSFSEAIHIKGGGGAAKFSKGGSMYKVDTNVLNELERKGQIKI